MALVTMVGMPTAVAQKKEFKEQIKKEATFDLTSNDKLLVVKNIYGSIKVEGYDGNKVLIEVEKSIWARRAEDLELGKTELKVKVKEEGDRIVIRPDAPYLRFDDGKLGFTWCNNEYEEPAYDHHLNFNLKIPKNIKVVVSTINDGEVLIENTRGSFLKAHNINGGIELKNVTGKTEVHAINGEVRVAYAKNPTEPSSYYSLNGDINISYQAGLSADIGFKSMNGELFTDFDIARQYTKTSKNEGESKGKYKFEARPMVQIGKGGLSHNFETLNGNVIITKI